jgi:molybdate transport system substrate-binding protein
MRWLNLLLCLLLLLTGCSGESSSGRGLRVAVAANLKPAFEEIASAFQKEHAGIRVTGSFGASGQFFAQLGQKAGFDVFLSADVKYPRRLIEDGVADKGSDFVYAVGKLVVWVPPDSKLEVSKGLAVVTDARVKKIAIANPRVAPYGKAAEAALKQAGLLDAVKSKLVLGEDVTQTAQFAQTGAADVAILPMSLALAPNLRDSGKHQELPAKSYPRIEQAGLILPWARDAEAARLFRDFLTGPEGRAILERHGYAVPEA